MDGSNFVRDFWFFAQDRGPVLLPPRHFVGTGPPDLLEDMVRLCLEVGMTRDEVLECPGRHLVAAVLARWDREALRLAAHLSDDPCPLEG